MVTVELLPRGPLLLVRSAERFGFHHPGAAHDAPEGIIRFVAGVLS